MARLSVNLNGIRFGKLTVLETDKKCFCECDCGAFTLVIKGNLTNHHTFSCGCLQKEKASELKLKHGHSKVTNAVSKTYKTWSGMKWRCGKVKGYENVNYCERWKEFSNFLEDMGERPEGKTLDRLDNFGDYELSNCRWATPREQCLNRRPYTHSKKGEWHE